MLFTYLLVLLVGGGFGKPLGELFTSTRTELKVALNHTVGTVTTFGLTNRTLDDILAAIPADQRTQVTSYANLGYDMYFECMPLRGATPSDCLDVASWIHARADNHSGWAIEVAPHYCWSVQSGTCRAFACAESDDQTLIVDAISFANELSAVLVPKCGSAYGLAAHSWDVHGAGMNFYLASFS
ncbi:hypothetical protein BX600DRAFT_497949 [Xylariales sp. PMI_506]|nr:hypothetical protein BX600DRAFT_497949 [Xylariales sp. PMI_506]